MQWIFHDKNKFLVPKDWKNTYGNYKDFSSITLKVGNHMGKELLVGTSLKPPIGQFDTVHQI